MRSDVRGDAQGPDVAKRIDPSLDPLRATLPLGYRIELGGAIEDSARGQKSIAAGVPLLVLTVLTLLDDPAAELLAHGDGRADRAARPDRRRRSALLAFGKPFGFVAMLGTIALSGIIMRNSIILVDQIEQDIAAGARAVGRRSSARRCAASGRSCSPRRRRCSRMIPLVRSDFFGPMAVAMMGGLVVATLLTLGFLPALYARVVPRAREPAGADPACAAPDATSPRDGRCARPGEQMRAFAAREHAAMTLATTPEIVAELKAGRMVVLVDEEDRENEGDLVFAADFVTPEKINFMAKHGRGLVCMPLDAGALPSGSSSRR